MISYNEVGNTVCSVWTFCLDCQFSTKVERICVISIEALCVASFIERPPVINWSIIHCGAESEPMSLIEMLSRDEDLTHDSIRVFIRSQGGAQGPAEPPMDSNPKTYPG